MGFASGRVTYKLEALCFYLSSVLVDSFVFRNPPERKARKRYASKIKLIKKLFEAKINYKHHSELLIYDRIESL